MSTATIFESPAQARDSVHEHGKTRFRCADCGAVKPCPAEPGAAPSGYAVFTDPGRGEVLLCYDCADKRQIADLLDRSKPFGAYLSSDGRTVTTWTGGALGRVTRWNPCRLTRVSYTHGREYRSIHVVDVHGAHWYGRTSPGIYVTLRPCTAPTA